MAVKDFLSPTDAKQPVEKPVKPHPTTQELTTVETPGKPVPMKLETPTKKKKRARKKKATIEPIKISKPIKDSILIVTEKPQAAQKIAEALGTPRKITSPDKVSYFELTKDGKTILVASAVGHLFNLTYSKGQKGWPIFKIEWEPSFNKKSAAFTKKYLDVLKKLARKAEQVIIATDYDIEGEVIGWNVLRFICGKQTAKRMKYSTLTKNELVQAYENPMPEPDWGQAYAGETRHILDWLYGINLSRALMSAIKTTGSFKILSIGRVQGPALKIIVEREHEIQKFKPEPFWQVFAIVDNFPYKHPKDIFNKEELEKFKKIKTGIATTKETEEKIQPLAPFDLTSLQREAYRWHKISPSNTLSTAQKLYLNGLISYPRTSSQKIPDSIKPKEILKQLTKQFPDQVKLATRKKPIEGKKDDPAHPSIYPTGELPKKLQDYEEKIYLLVAKRFISAFSPDAITLNKRTKITATLDERSESSNKTPVTKNGSPIASQKKPADVTFTASGLKIKDKGWTQIYPTALEEKDIPTLNGEVNIDEIKFEEKETQPPKRFTPTSLITILEKKNLGTKATRSSIVDTLFDRGYLDGRSIQATPLGMQLIESLEKYSPIIIDENLTRQLEEEMENLREPQGADEFRGDASKSESERIKLYKERENKIIQKVERLITDISKEFKAKEIQIGKAIMKGVEEHREIERQNNTLNQCPACKKGNLRITYSPRFKSYFIGCSNYPDCKQTYGLPGNALIKKSDKTCESCGFPKVLVIKKAKRPWELCFNKDCEIVKKNRKEWEAKKKNWKNKKEDKE